MATNEKQPLATRLHALSELQKTLSRLQYQTEHGAPWYSRFGLNQNDDLLAALLPRYGENAIPLLRDAAAVHLQQQLNAYVQLPPDSPLREKMTKTAWEQLKLYLMLARPERMDAAWFSGALMQDWPQRPGVKDGIWQGSGASLLRFYGESLATHPAWRLHPDDGLISQVRTLLIRQMGMRNSESTLYQKMLAQVANQYSLSSGICRYDITTVLLQNGERSASIIPEQLCQGAETGCVTMCVEAPGTRQVFHLSMAPETGWYLRGEHQSVCERVSMTEEGFFQAVDRLA